MPIKIPPHETAEAVQSLKKYFSAEFDQDISDLQAKILLDYILKDIAPLAYNQGVKDSEDYFRSKTEELSATCFEPGLTYWQKKRR